MIADKRRRDLILIYASTNRRSQDWRASYIKNRNINSISFKRLLIIFNIDYIYIYISIIIHV